MKKRQWKCGRRLRRLTLLGGVALTALASPALSQEATEDDPKVDRGLGEIVVTANKRAQDVQDVSIAITSIDGDRLATTGTTDVDDIIKAVPGVQVSAGANGSTFSIRGVTSVGGGGEIDPGISFSVDGVYDPFDNIALMSYYDLDRVEVLRGPQGTLYGRNAVAGAINVITKDPVLGDLSGFVRGGIGNYDFRSVTGAVNVPLGEDLAIRVAGDTRSHDGYVSNGGNDLDQWGGRVKLLYKPTNAFRLVIGTDYAKSGGVGNSDIFLPLDPNDPWNSAEIAGSENVEQYGVFAQADVDIGLGTLSVIPAYRHMEQQRYSTILGSTPLTFNRVVNDQYTGEVRLASNSSYPLDWVVGAFFYDNVQSFRILNPPDLLQEPLKTRSYAGFGQLTYSVLPTVRLIGGLRYTRDHKQGVNYNYGATPTAVVTNDQVWNTWTYKVGAEADLAPENMVYANISTGFKAGGTYPAAGDSSFEPEHLTAYLIGSKNRFFDGNAQLNVEAFYYDYTDLQVAYIEYDVAFGAVGRKVDNAGKATTYGVEAEFEANVTPNDRISGSLAYFHGKYDEYIQKQFLAPSLDYSGYAMPLPNWTGSFGYDHFFDLAGGGTVTFSAMMNWKGDYYTHVSRNPLSKKNAYAKFDASLTYDAPNGGWSLSAYMKNIGNKPVKTGVFLLGGGGTTWLEPPRTYGLTLQANF